MTLYQRQHCHHTKKNKTAHNPPETTHKKINRAHVSHHLLVQKVHDLSEFHNGRLDLLGTRWCHRESWELATATLPETNSKFAPENRPSQRKCIFQPLIFRQRYQGGYQNCRARLRSNNNRMQTFSRLHELHQQNPTTLSTHPSNDLWPPTNSFQWTR